MIIDSAITILVCWLVFVSCLICYDIIKTYLLDTAWHLFVLVVDCWFVWFNG